MQRLDHLLWRLTTQETARANAAEAAAALRRRRREQEEVDAYLLGVFGRSTRQPARPESPRARPRPS